MGQSQTPAQTPALSLSGAAKSPAKGGAILITGVARGGTSYAASVCSHLGIDLGRGGPRYENPFLQRAVVKEDWEAVEKISHELSAAMPLWGWKLPAIVSHLARIDGIVTNPRYIFVIRNAVGTIPRRAADGSRSLAGRTLSRVCDHYRDIGMFVRETGAPCLLLNFEAAIARPEEAVLQVADFCGVECADPSEVARQVALDADAYKAGDGAKSNRQGVLYDPSHALYKKVRKIAKLHGIERPGSGATPA